MIAARLRKLRSNARGSMAIETAFVVPVLVLLSLGTFEVSNIVSRQNELQSIAAEAEIIALAANAGATTDVNSMSEILKASGDLADDQITIEQFYRCNDSEETVASSDSCDEDDVVSSYVRLNLNDSYTPLWTEFGVGKTFDFEVERTVFLS